MKILVTGGAGYLGSHTCVELIESGHEVVVLDNFSNSSPESLRRVQKLTGREIAVIEGDVRSESCVRSALREHRCEGVIHFAALKSVGESVQSPLLYYDNNITALLTLLQTMKVEGVKKLVFSSSATVYGEPRSLPITETHPLSTTNPYGATKLFGEQILVDLFRSDPGWSIVLLRYFNPVGAHESGQIGESSRGTPNNLMPYVAQVACGTLEKLRVWGNDYPTPDGTGVRDYLHVVDLARGHEKALRLFDQPLCQPINLGTGKGFSVLEVISEFERASGKTIPFEFSDRRTGDVPSCYADPSLAAQLLDWRAQYSLAEMCSSQWRWQSENPNGY